MPPRKKPAKPTKPENTQPEDAAEAARKADFLATMKLVDGVMDWYLMKVNGDPLTEGFDVLMNVEGPDGTTGHKYSFGDTDASIERLRKDLETEYAGCLRYAHANAGWWQKPDGAKFDGAIVFIESHHVLPTVLGIPIAADATGRKAISGELQILSRANWSLLHRAPPEPHN